MSKTDASTLPGNVSALEAMDRPALLETWRVVFGTPPPKSLSKPFLRRFLAFELQTCRHGGLSRDILRKLETEPASVSRPAPALQAGSRLLREWNGTTHVVDVVGDGFLWQGACYRSLSAVARAITGARWSGPRFFGLRS